jgi:hypothetical protein
MTTTKRSDAAKQPEAASPPPRPADPDRLDAEIVKDLELDEHAEDVRGGRCAKDGTLATQTFGA